MGSENWGKAINCDPPQYFPDVKFYWARDYFPNFVEEDRRVMVSYDGYLYFSSLEKIDRVSVYQTVKIGPFFHASSLFQTLYQGSSINDIIPHANI